MKRRRERRWTKRVAQRKTAHERKEKRERHGERGERRRGRLRSFHTKKGERARREGPCTSASRCSLKAREWVSLPPRSLHKLFPSRGEGEGVFLHSLPLPLSVLLLTLRPHSAPHFRKEERKGNTSHLDIAERSQERQQSASVGVSVCRTLTHTHTRTPLLDLIGRDTSSYRGTPVDTHWDLQTLLSRMHVYTETEGERRKERRRNASSALEKSLRDGHCASACTRRRLYHPRLPL